MITRLPIARQLAALLVAVSLVAGSDRASASPGDVEQRIAEFWARVNAMQPGDYLSSADVGQWALNVIERNSRVRMTVADFRASTAEMQAAMDRAGLAPAGPTSTPVPTQVPRPAAFTFGSGTKLVPAEVPAGTYRTRSASSGCYWERLSGFGGTLGEIVANNGTDAPEIVTISATDKGFNSSRCAQWSADLSAITSSQLAPFGSGKYLIGVDIAAGTWRSAGGTSCYWERLSGFGGHLGDIIANGIGGDGTIVTISPSDRGFSSTRCGTWTKIG